MPHERFYLKESFKENETYQIRNQEFHHLAHVMRMREGEDLELVNGMGFLANASIVQMRKDHAEVQVEQVFFQEPVSTSLFLAQAIPKPNRLEVILEKGTELGVDYFWLFNSQNSFKKDFNANQMERLNLILISAMKQSGRLYLPELSYFRNLEECFPPDNSQPFFGDISPEAPPLCSVIEKGKTTIFYVGPESGFTSSEIQIMQKMKIRGVKLHRNILRTETAAMAACALISHLL